MSAFAFPRLLLGESPSSKQSRCMKIPYRRELLLKMIIIHSCISTLFILHILQFETSKLQFVLVKFRIFQIVFRDIKSVTTYETHLVKILVTRKLGLTDDIQVFIKYYDRELTPHRIIERRFVCFKLIRKFSDSIIYIPIFIIYDIVIFGATF